MHHLHNGELGAWAGLFGNEKERGECGLAYSGERFTAIILIQYNSEFIHLLFLLFSKKSLSCRVVSAKVACQEKEAVSSDHYAVFYGFGCLGVWIREEVSVSLAEEGL